MNKQEWLRQEIEKLGFEIKQLYNPYIYNFIGFGLDISYDYKEDLLVFEKLTPTCVVKKIVELIEKYKEMD